MKSISILMVEDHKLLRVGLRSLFNESNDIKVIAEAETGKEAVEKGFGDAHFLAQSLNAAVD